MWYTIVNMHVFKKLKENTASENSPGRSNAKIYIFRSRGTFWERRFTYLRHMWKLFFEGWIMGEIGWKICGFQKISRQEWGRGERW